MTEGNWTLSADDADKLNVGKSVDPGQNSEDAPGFHKEGDSVVALPLPDGTAVVVTGVSGGVLTGVVLDVPEEDETPEDFEIQDRDLAPEDNPNLNPDQRTDEAVQVSNDPDQTQTRRQF